MFGVSSVSAETESVSDLCVHPECDRPVARRAWRCAEHWNALPNGIREKLKRSFRLLAENEKHPYALLPDDVLEIHTHAYNLELMRLGRITRYEEPA